ncbi:MAG: eukaryotic-like serine/threonine-protein kinase [Verrucomicrobiota bacterium]
MQRERGERVAEIIERLLESRSDEQAAITAELCGGDLELRAEIESLLQFQDRARDFIETPGYALAAKALVDDSGELKPGDRLGDYKIISLLGEGGMGEVYLAADTALERKVAIKLVKRGFGTADFIRRFQQEGRILAGLNHPNIARLYGASVTENGIPYFVMEYVDGVRLDQYCREKRSSIEERLTLFRQVCTAVTYAHQNLVIHRDLKPANIRVTVEGEAKLLDFGIAKLLDPARSPSDQQTLTIGSAMTPEYASPEQVRGENMTTVSDVYSLGVVLYELLTGVRPYRINSQNPGEIARAITEREPTRPSTAIARSKSDPPESAVSNPKLLRGDLDNIILKALRKEPERRYISVGQFSEDIRRHLMGRPVVAQKDTVAYRTSKFIARNRVAVSAAVLIFLAIISGLIIALWEAENARDQRDVARQERLKAERITTFLQDMLGAAAPEVKGVDVKVSDVLGEASSRAKSELVNQPEVMADVLTTLGRTYISLGQYDKAERDLRAAFIASSKVNGELHPTTATSMGWLGLALAYQNKMAEGERISRRAVELQRRLHPEGHENLGVALYSLGLNLVSKNESKAAQPVLEEAALQIKKHLGENHGYYMATLVMGALAHERSGDVDGAETLYHQAIAVGAKVEYRYRIFLAQASIYLGALLTDKGNYVEAEDLLRKGETLYREQLGDSNSSVGATKQYLGRNYFVQGDYANAKIEYEKSLELVLKYFSREHPVTASGMAGLGLTLTRLQNSTAGEPYLRDALAMRNKILPPGNLMIFDSEIALGECLSAQQHYAEAEPLLLEGYNGLKSKRGDQNRRVAEGRQQLLRLYEAWGKPEQAAMYR